MKGWLSDEYQSAKKNNYEILISYLKTPPASLLDIGCGLAWESRLFNDNFNTELWLLDGDESQNTANATDAGYHSTHKDFLFYHTLTELRNELEQRNTKNFYLIDSNDIKIPNDKKFDIITSWLSCGFHYPVSTYKDLILTHSKPSTKIFVDLRIDLKTKEIYLEPGVEIISILGRYKKHVNAEIKFI